VNELKILGFRIFWVSGAGKVKVFLAAARVLVKQNSPHNLPQKSFFYFLKTEFSTIWSYNEASLTITTKKYVFSNAINARGSFIPSIIFEKSENFVKNFVLGVY